MWSELYDPSASALLTLPFERLYIAQKQYSQTDQQID